MEEDTLRASLFGTELRRLRLLAGLSLTDLAGRVNYSKSHLSKIERGEKAPTADFARRCDSFFARDGALASLVSVPDLGDTGRDDGWSGLHTADGPWLIRFDPDGGGQFLAPGQPRLDSRDEPGMFRWRPSPPSAEPAGAMLAPILGAVRAMARSAASGAVFPLAVALVGHARDAARNSRTDRASLLKLGSRSAELCGWLAQECGDDRASLWWTKLAVELSDAAGDTHMVAYAYVRRALVALYCGDAQLAQRLAATVAERPTVSPGIRRLAAQREAQAYAAMGDLRGYRRAIGRAADISDMDNAADTSGLGPGNSGDLLPIVTGWCQYDLGNADQAVDLLDRHVPAIPATSHRARARFEVRRALAYTDVDVARSCDLMHSVLPDVRRVDSATVRSDLHAYTRAVARWQHRNCVQELMPQLLQALSGPSYP
ncbi:helix-turn-helix transcriptional regulator [Catellatospora sp. NPDC049111]|uniref:helix-turn-helix domain-containing protein n=1 Tax=Catellatospora sp. NPDC049111 TaxID=3155271 RepID=UPI0033DDBE65